MPIRDLELRRKYQRDYQREWKKKNPSKISAYSRKYYEKKREYFAAKARRWNEENPGKRAEYWMSWSYGPRLLKKYGISKQQFEYMLSQQKHCCAICREPFTSPRNRHVDHDHEKCIVRGILCQRCNLAVGLLRNSATIALEVAHYLNQQPRLTNAAVGQ